MTALNVDDVIGQQGQTLSALELDVLVAMANGNSMNAIQAATGTDSATMRMIELQVRAKLGAKTPGHMIARGFILGVLLPRALCALIATSCALANDHYSNRNRLPIRGRMQESLTRLMRSSGNNRSSRHYVQQHEISSPVAALQTKTINLT